MRGTKQPKPSRPSQQAQDVAETVWYYEYPRTLLFVVECRSPEEGYHRTLQFKVPARMLERSLARMSPPPKRGAR